MIDLPQFIDNTPHRLNILLTGANGQLGQAIQQTLKPYRDIAVNALSHKDFDITDRKQVEQHLHLSQYTHIINCAAYTAVDKAESDKETCNKINIEGVGNLALASAERGIKVLHFSTDYVFDGKAKVPYKEDSIGQPLNVYGQSKLDGEKILFANNPDCIVLRTGWLYSAFGHNFVKTILRNARQGTLLRVVSDQTGTPTFAEHLASAVASILISPEWIPGIYNYTNEGQTTWYEFAKKIIEDTYPNAFLTACATTDYHAAAQRPAFSVLDKSKIKQTFNITIPHWTEGLKECLEVLQNNDN
ncbi:MAG: dTDP-4-dehydrorhamnose reductase [Muribaculaceae bacterium]|nr:dTDP-4-dehydrorhamnose reductase [Muribaculaceae bacterium]